MGKECHVLEVYHGKKIIFLDEKTFNLDRLDGNNYYWYVVRQGFREFYSRQMRSGFVMVWDAFLFAGNSILKKLMAKSTKQLSTNVMRNSYTHRATFMRT